MGNRKQQIENLEREINQKQQTLNELKEAEDRKDPEVLSDSEINGIVTDLLKF
jgi:flagellar biosynthesis chaperone FliJ